MSDDVIDLGARRKRREDEDAMMADAGGFYLTMEFDTNDPEFARGFEVGAVHGKLANEGPAEHIAVCHCSNATMLARIAQVDGYDLDLEVIDDTWLKARFTRGKNGRGA